VRTLHMLTVAIALLTVAVPAQADTITLKTPADGPYERVGTLSDAVFGYGDTMGQQQAFTSDLEAYFGAGTWTRVGDKNSTDGPNGGYDFDAVLDNGSFWNGTKVDGTWSFDASIWSDHGQVAVTMHVGGGPQPPDDHFAWMITPGTTSGRFSYERLAGGGGGFSNMQVWVRGVGDGVPEPATGLLLLGALLGYAGLRRRRAN